SIVFTRLSAFMASWKTIDPSIHRRGALLNSPPASTAVPWKHAPPATLAVGRRSPRKPTAVGGLPQPAPRSQQTRPPASRRRETAPTHRVQASVVGEVEPHVEATDLQQAHEGPVSAIGSDRRRNVRGERFETFSRGLSASSIA